MKKSLESSEWLLISSLLAILLSLILIAKINTHRASVALSTQSSQSEECSAEIRIFINGAVEKPIELIVPTGTRICDLKSKVLFTADVDKSFLKRRRKLKNREILTVPKKSIE